MVVVGTKKHATDVMNPATGYWWKDRVLPAPRGWGKEVASGSPNPQSLGRSEE